MDRKKLILLLGALVIAIGTALAARSMFAGASAPQAEAKQAPQGPKVLVAQRAMPVGTIITADAVGYQLWPEEMVQDAYFLEGEADMTQLLGTVVRFPVTAGEPVTQGALVAPGDRGFLAAALGAGMRAVTVPVSARTGVAGFVFPGDRVDLVLTQSVSGEGDGGGLKASETIIRNLRVLATDQKTDAKTNEDGKTVVSTSRTVTLEVTPKIAEKVAVAQTIGTLSLSLRSLADNQAELERAIAAGEVDVPEGASPAEEEEILRTTMNMPNDKVSSFVTGGDVSRFQPRAIESTNKSAGAPEAFQQAAGPQVRVTRGKAASTVDLPTGASGLVSRQSAGVSQAGAMMPVAQSTVIR